MIDMQARIGSYKSLQRRLTSQDMKNASCSGRNDTLFGDLLPNDGVFMSNKSYSTRESLGNMSKGLISEEELHE